MMITASHGMDKFLREVQKATIGYRLILFIGT
jgi:hypothetical protein